jgi:hypothetical protein
MLDLAREECEGHGAMNDIVRLDVPFSKPFFIILKVSQIDSLVINSISHRT